ncbi:MAG: hypothetical protein ABI548_20930 [Polyangiaceae bacterium]
MQLSKQSGVVPGATPASGLPTTQSLTQEASFAHPLSPAAPPAPLSAISQPVASSQQDVDAHVLHAALPNCTGIVQLLPPESFGIPPPAPPAAVPPLAVPPAAVPPLAVPPAAVPPAAVPPLVVPPLVVPPVTPVAALFVQAEMAATQPMTASEAKVFMLSTLVQSY